MSSHLIDGLDAWNVNTESVALGCGGHQLIGGHHYAVRVEGLLHAAQFVVDASYVFRQQVQSLLHQAGSMYTIVILATGTTTTSTATAAGVVLCSSMVVAVAATTTASVGTLASIGWRFNQTCFQETYQLCKK